jgi:sRNA-binding regulator protein Hfq
MAPNLTSTGRNDNTGQRRRHAPADSTHKETEYIDWLSKNRIPVVVKLEDNEELRGWIEYYDRDIIRLTRNDDSNLFIYKDRMKYLYEDPAHSHRRR